MVMKKLANLFPRLHDEEWRERTNGIVGAELLLFVSLFMGWQFTIGLIVFNTIQLIYSWYMWRKQVKFYGDEK